MLDCNPLLNLGLPEFDQISLKDMSQALQLRLAEAGAAVESIAYQAESATWHNTFEPLDSVLEKLDHVWGVVGHLNSVKNTSELRVFYDEWLPVLTDFYTKLGQNKSLFKRYQSIDASKLLPVEQRVLKQEIRDFVLSGADLPENAKKRFLEIAEALAEKTNIFANHVLDATEKYRFHTLNEDDLLGIPEQSLALYRSKAKDAGLEGFVIDLQFPSYFPVMQYADRRELRQTIYQAYVTRASELGDAEFDNTILIEEILALRHEEALLLGFESYAALSLYTKMAKDVDVVNHFLAEMAQKAKPFALKDRQELVEFAQLELGIQDLQAWDLSYASEKLRVARYNFSELEVKDYFELEAVLGGLFYVVETLYGITIKPFQASVWHSDVRYYQVLDKEQTVIAGFYLDLFAREGKRGGAWMDEALRLSKNPSLMQEPVAYLVCNFNAPVEGQLTTLTHDDVITLFHEAGHGLHHMLTKVDCRPVSGIRGVEWDAVELPSQFMENFCWEWDVLLKMTRHIRTGEALPLALYHKMIAAKNFQSGMATVRQLEFALFDLKIHARKLDKGDVEVILQEVREQVCVNPVPAYNRFAHSFTHIFAGGYAAGYYSYKWAEVLSADAYAAFEEVGGLNAEIGQRFWQEILAVGGSRDAMDSFEAFRGRQPSMDALLRHSGFIGNEELLCVD